MEKGLADAGENDMILLSDVDEIPNPRVLQELKQNFDPDKVYHLAQRMFYCFINMEEVSGNLLSITGEFPGVERRMWLGTKIFAKRSIPKDGIIQLREAKVTAPNAVRVADGGWHFGYMGTGMKQMCPRELEIKSLRQHIRNTISRIFWQRQNIV